MQLACTSWIEVEASTLPELSAESSAQLQRAVETGQEGNFSPSTAVTGTTIQDAEGEDVLIRPPYDARITTAEGRLEVPGPVAAAITGADLIVQGPETERVSVELEEIDTVEVSQFATVKTYLLILGLTLAVAGGGLAIIAID